LPEWFTGSSEDLICFLSAVTLDRLSDLSQLEKRSKHDVDVICHDHPGPQIVFLPNAFTQQQSFSDTCRYPWLLEPSWTGIRQIQAPVLSEKALPFSWQATSLPHIHVELTG